MSAVGAGLAPALTKGLRAAGYVYEKDYMAYLDPQLHKVIDTWPQAFRLRFFADIDSVRKTNLSSVRSAVLDRTFLTIFAHDFARKTMGVQVDVDGYEQVDPDNILWPNKVVFLSVDEKVRASRLLTRRNAGDSYFAEPAFNSAIRQFFHLMEEVISMQWVDSTELSPQDVITEVTEGGRQGNERASRPRLVFNKAWDVLRHG